MKKELLRMNHISLSHQGESLLHDLNFQIYAGEIMGLIARNQKGCDRLIDLICYNHPIGFGSVWYDGKTVNRYSYSDGTSNKVAVIEQKSHLVDALSVADNLFVMRKGFKKYLLNERVLCHQAEAFFQEHGISVNINKQVNALSSLERSLVELGKALLTGTRLVIVDNPGNFLSQYELPGFQQMLQKISKEGVSVLYIGNHHQDVFKIADRTALFSDGQMKKVFDYGEMTDENIAPYITDFQERQPAPDPGSGEGIVHFHHVYTEHLQGLDFVINKGECLTLLDMENKISEDIQGLMTGEISCLGGRITLEHMPYPAAVAERYLNKGVAIIPGDSYSRLLFPERTYMENLTFLLDRKLGKSIIGSRIYKSIQNEYRELVGEVIDETNIGQLSLKDQLSLVYYRIQLLNPKLLICIQPLAKGDMYCRRHILELIQNMMKRGIAVLIVTNSISDTPEVADRFLVVEGGTCVALYEKSEFYQLIH